MTTTKDAMELGKESILKVIDELRTHTVTHWDAMIANAAEIEEKDLSDRLKGIIKHPDFRDAKCHRFASILCLVRYLRDFAYDQDDKNFFNASVRQVVGEGLDLEELLAKVMPAIVKAKQAKEEADKEDTW